MVKRKRRKKRKRQKKRKGEKRKKSEEERGKGGETLEGIGCKGKERGGMNCCGSDYGQDIWGDDDDGDDGDDGDD
eukprot:CAMPEP_0175057774 /NCGR_PEP_ID=MMETSP0052_2-20121109/11455_1 /TAXON_ID=51329 ORGANISM="Polytomella parva, Strain SAG 63-3" /NCGR_SAMPLE_ID=MMETSP0052_2 /ASSEMBLY_ACC=CAM_ASM_000194 /LENGTH=74 /DNA_ID=CAMNT_0016323033 /DNA_START=224 /DNA_END=445 /DNA_ORIENTATION=+